MYILPLTIGVITYQHNIKSERFTPGFVNYNKGSTRLAAASDKVYQLLTHGWWFSPGTPASSTTKTGRQDIAEILLKVALSTINQIKLKVKVRNIVYVENVILNHET